MIFVFPFFKGTYITTGNRSPLFPGDNKKKRANGGHEGCHCKVFPYFCILFQYTASSASRRPSICAFGSPGLVMEQAMDEGTGRTPQEWQELVEALGQPDATWDWSRLEAGAFGDGADGELPA